MLTKSVGLPTHTSEMRAWRVRRIISLLRGYGRLQPLLQRKLVSTRLVIVPLTARRSLHLRLSR